MWVVVEETQHWKPELCGELPHHGPSHSREGSTPGHQDAGDMYKRKKTTTVNREIFVFKNLRVINFRVKKSSSASGSDEDF